MKKFIYSLILGVIFLLASNSIFAQPWIENLKEKNPGYNQLGSNLNFYDVQKSFYDYWSDKDTTKKGIGWKQFKRWEWFWGQRVYPTGIFPGADQPFTELKSFQKNYKSKNIKNSIQSNAGWTSLGPFTNAGGYGGLGRINTVKESPINPNTVYIGSASGGFWISTNSGATWTTTTDELASIGVTDIAIHPISPNVIFIATGDGDASDAYSVGVMKSIDGGMTWMPTGLNWSQSQTRTISRLLIDPSNPNIMYAGGNMGIYKSQDGGMTWNQIFSSMTVRDIEFKPGNTSVLYAGGAYIYRSTNGGTSWSQLTSGLPSSAQRVALGVSPANASFVYALMSNSSSGFLGLYRSTDSGDTWTTQSTTPNILGWDISGGDTGGQGWYDLCMAVDQTNANVIYTGGVNVWKSTNGGVNWTLSAHWYGGGGAAEVHADIHDLWFVPNTNRLYAGNDGGIYKTIDNGSTWQWLGSGLAITQFYRLGASQTVDNIWIAGAQDNGTKNYVGGNWQDVIGGDGMECIVDHTNPNYQYGSIYYGRILRSSDGGYNFYDWVSPSSFSSENGAWVTPYVMHPTDNQTIFVGFRNIYKTTNRGSSWTKISNFGSSSVLQLLNVDPDNASYMYASHGYDLYMSPDGGATWNTKSLPGSYYLTYLAIKPGSPQTIYASFSGYTAGVKVYVSNDAGTTWINLSYNLPNLPVNTIVYQKNTGRLYIGNDIGCYYLDPGQTTWMDFNNNLPNVIVNEIELQPAFSKMKVATYGRGVWETPIFSGNSVSLISPANATINVNRTPTLSWDPINLASGYELMLADNSSFTNPKIYNTNLTTTNYTLSGGEILNQVTTYYWKVRAKDDNAFGLWSNTYSFTTTQNPPGPTVLKKPDNFATVYVTDVNLSWFESTDASTYDLQVSTNSNFTNLIKNQTGLTGLNYTAVGLPNGTYFWRARGVNSVGIGSWSNTYTFTVEYIIPAKVTLSSPTNNATGISLSTSLQWLSAFGAVNYELIVAKDINFTDLVLSTGSINSLAYSISGLSYYTNYYWKVRGIHPSNNGPWSDIWTFQTVPAPFVLNISDKLTCKDSPVSLGTLDANNKIITAQGGSGDFEYTWYPSLGLLNSTTGNPIFASPQYSTSFSLTVRDRVYNTFQSGTVYVQVSSQIAINMPFYKVIRRNSTIDLNSQISTITGGTPPYTKVWKDNFGNIIYNTLITPPLGTNNYYLTVNDQYGCSTTKKLIVIVSPYKESINEENITSSDNGELAIVAYPNPTAGNLNYYLISNDENQVQIEVHDLNGKILLQTASMPNSDLQTINLSGVPSGTYFMKLNNGKVTLLYKFIKK